MPLRKVSKSEYKRRFKPWLTDMILEQGIEKTLNARILLQKNININKTK